MRGIDWSSVCEGTNEYGLLELALRLGCMRGELAPE